MKLLIKERGKYEGLFNENLVGIIRTKHVRYEDGLVRVPISAAQLEWLRRKLPPDPQDEDDVDMFNAMMEDALYWRKAWLAPSCYKDRKGRTIWNIVYNPNNIFA